MQESFTIRRLSPELLPELATLFWEIFGVKHELEFLRWKYDSPALEASYLGFMGFDQQNKPIGFCGGIPCRLAYQGMEIRGIQLCDTMTLPAWRGKGLWGRLANTLGELALAENILFHFGIVNEDSYHASQKKLPWDLVGEMRRFAFPVHTLPLQKLGQRVPWVEKVQEHLLETALAPFAQIAQLPNHLTDDGKLAVIHDEAFFHYKLRPGQRLLDLDAAQVWIKAKRGLWIGDMMLKENYTPKDVVDQLRQIAFRAGIHHIHAQFAVGSNLEAQFRTFDLGKTSWKITARSYDPRIPASALALTLGDMDTF